MNLGFMDTWPLFGNENILSPKMPATTRQVQEQQRELQRKQRRVAYFGRRPLDPLITWRPTYPEYNAAYGKTYNETTPIEEVPLFDPPEDWYDKLSRFSEWTWPPRHVHLSDRAVGALIKLGFLEKTLYEFWPLDFIKTNIAPERLPAGAGYMIGQGPTKSWALCKGQTVLLGDVGVLQYGVEARSRNHPQNVHVELLCHPNRDTIVELLPSGCRVHEAVEGLWTSRNVIATGKEESRTSLPALWSHAQQTPKLTLEETPRGEKQRYSSVGQNQSSNKRKRESMTLGAENQLESKTSQYIEGASTSFEQPQLSSRPSDEMNEARHYNLGMELGSMRNDRLEIKHLCGKLRENDRAQRDLLLVTYPQVVQDEEFSRLEVQKERLYGAIASRACGKLRVLGSEDLRRGLEDVKSELEGRDWAEWTNSVLLGQEE